MLIDLTLVIENKNSAKGYAAPKHHPKLGWLQTLTHAQMDGKQNPYIEPFLRHL